MLNLRDLKNTGSIFVESNPVIRTEHNIRLFRHSAYKAHSPNPNMAWKRKGKEEKAT